MIRGATPSCPWVKLQCAPEYALVCERCDARRTFALPMDLDAVISMLEAFERAHAGCRAAGPGPRGAS